MTIYNKFAREIWPNLNRMRPGLSLNRSLATLIVMAFLACCSVATYTFNGSPYDPPRPAPDLELQRASGGAFDLEEFSGDIVLIYFGYTYCPDICPTTLADVKLILEQLGDHADRVHMVMVTVDPDRDQPEFLRTYLDRFNPGFVGLWGQGEELENILTSYGVFAQKEPSEDPDRYLVSHTARLFLIGPQGSLRTNYTFGTPREEILADLEYLITEELQ